MTETKRGASGSSRRTAAHSWASRAAVRGGKNSKDSAGGWHALAPISDGASPAQGADRKGPTAVTKSLSKIDIAETGGSLLNQRFLPQTLEGEKGIDSLASLIKTYFRMGGHHIQFNVVDTATLREAQKRPEDYRSLLVRVAGYSDYFVDLDRNHQEEIISRTAQEAF